eukprot:TRINITY_DN23473_c0_g1_i3.p1 TRINITY_DN23473_c0_g1~~TRINITY_DN23473_c0_g1_i3.p1  ORF type:complete len:234 (+),score=43.94 TRINITY_DN23473_c0_g1_i3:396-1097(+)
MHDVDRVPISFKSTAAGNIYRHIVLAVKHGNKYGALGISRKAELAYKPLKFKSFSSLLAEFKQCYQSVNHKLLSIKVGLPVSHDTMSHHRICWRHSHIKVPVSETLRGTPRAAALDRLAMGWHKHLDKWRATGDWSDDEGVPLSKHDCHDHLPPCSKSSGNKSSKLAPSTPHPQHNGKSPLLGSAAEAVTEDSEAVTESRGFDVDYDDGSSSEDEPSKPDKSESCSNRTMLAV